MDVEKRKLIKENRRLRARVEELEGTVRGLQEQVQILSAALEEARRAGKRQAAPFRKGKIVAKPKTPGRKRGKDHGTHAHRMAPEEASVEEDYEAPLPCECPRCGSARLEEDDPPTEQFQTEIVCRTVRRRFTMHRGHCLACGTPIRGRHAWQTSTAMGAAGEQLGPKAHALMSVLNKRLGLSHGKIAWTFQRLFGLRIDRSTSARSGIRTARRLATAYQQIRDDVRAAEEVTPDETGWRVGGRKAWLHALASAQTACYDIDPTRSGDVAQRLLGSDWSGRLVHDGWSVYDRFLRAIHQQCNAHLLNRCKELLEVARRGAARLPWSVKRLLQTGLAARDRFGQGEISPHGLSVIAGRLTAKLQRVVGGRFTHDGNRRLAKFLSNHLDEVFAYLRHPGMAATNYRGEQAIRPAVVNRKVWGGNRTWLGAWAQSVIMSVIGTCMLRDVEPLPLLANALISPTPLLLPSLT